MLNEYSTGICVTACAFIRFCNVCYPTDNILTRKVLFIIAAVIIIYPFLAMGVNFLFMGLMIYPRVASKKSPIESVLEVVGGIHMFLHNCASFQVRHSLRLFLDCLVCLVVPGLLSAGLYIKVAHVLLKRNRNQSRNRSLTIAFAISWLLWLSTWIPYYALLFVGISLRSDGIEENERNLIYYVIRQSLSLLYSHLNPIILLAVLKPHSAFLVKIFKVLFMTRKGGSRLPKTHNPTSRKSKDCKTNKSKIVEKAKFRYFIVFLAAAVIVCFCTSFLGSIVVQFETINLKEAPYKISKSMQFEMNPGRLRAIANCQDLLPQMLKPRELCAAKYGKVSVPYKRCYFNEKNVEKRLNLTEQMDFCRSQSSVLFYPRTYQELLYVKNFIESSISLASLSFEDAWFFHLGLRRAYMFLDGSSKSSTFLSADNELIMNGMTHRWFIEALEDLADMDYDTYNYLKELQWVDYSFIDYAIHSDRNFYGSSACMSADGFLFGCLPRFTRETIICSIDLISKPEHLTAGISNATLAEMFRQIVIHQ